MATNLNLVVLDNGSVVVQRFSMDHDFVVYRVYEGPISMTDHSHHSISSLDGQLGDVFYGSMVSRALPANVAQLPVGDERMAKCAAFRSWLYAECYRYIELAFPETRGFGTRTCGDIGINDAELVCVVSGVELYAWASRGRANLRTAMLSAVHMP